MQGSVQIGLAPGGVRYFLTHAAFFHQLWLFFQCLPFFIAIVHGSKGVGVIRGIRHCEPDLTSLNFAAIFHGLILPDWNGILKQGCRCVKMGLSLYTMALRPYFGGANAAI
jgi:hypothetical protein